MYFYQSVFSGRNFILSPNSIKREFIVLLFELRLDGSVLLKDEINPDSFKSC